MSESTTSRGHWPRGRRRNPDTGDWSALRLDLQSIIDRYYLAEVRSIRALADAMAISDRSVRKHLAGTSRPSVDLQERYRAWLVEQRLRLRIERTPLPPPGRASNLAADSCVGPGNPARTFLPERHSGLDCGPIEESCTTATASNVASAVEAPAARYSLSRRQQKELASGRVMHICLPHPPASADPMEWARLVLDTAGHVIARAERTDLSVSRHSGIGGTGLAGRLGAIMHPGESSPAQTSIVAVVLVHVARADVAAEMHNDGGKHQHGFRAQSRPQWPLEAARRAPPSTARHDHL